MDIGEFDRDADALKERIQTYDDNAEQSLNDWIFSHLEPETGASVLDLGSGTGKQSIPLAKQVGEDGNVFSVDVSGEALDTLGQRAADAGIADRIETHQTEFADLGTYVENEQFDQAVGSYSLYYADDPETLFETVYDALVDGGQLFYCGPSRANNYEIEELRHEAGGREPQETETSVFIEDRSQEIAESLFDTVEVFNFQNSVSFDSPEDLYNYWRNHNMYNEEIDDAFQSEVTAHFEEHDSFELIKRVIGVLATK
jgi:ubiquinone/menaquinone biosynthesis C-methylase UbiE